MRCGQFLQRYHESVDRREPPEADPQLTQHAATCPDCARWLAVQRLWEDRWGSQVRADRSDAHTPHESAQSTGPSVGPSAVPSNVPRPAGPRREESLEWDQPVGWRPTWMSLAAVALLAVLARNQLAPLGIGTTDLPAGSPAPVAVSAVGSSEDLETLARLLPAHRELADPGRSGKGEFVRIRSDNTAGSTAPSLWHGSVVPWSPVMVATRLGVLDHDPWARWGSRWGWDRPWSLMRRPWDSVREMGPEWIDPLVSHLRPLSRRMERAWSLLLRSWSSRSGDSSDAVAPDASAAEGRLELLRRVC